MDQRGSPRSTPPKKSPKDEEERRRRMQRQIRYTLTYILAGLIIVWLFQQFLLGPMLNPETPLTYDEFKNKIVAGEIVSAEIGEARIQGEMKNPDQESDRATVPFKLNARPDSDPELIPQLQSAGVKYSFSSPSSPVGSILLAYVLPLALLGVFWYVIYRRSRAMGGAGAGGLFGVGKSKATQVSAEQVGVTFKDVGGADEAIAELQEIIQFLKNPQQFAKLGGRIPKGVMLVGPPGTGKTLLAKATAGEAGVAFFESSGSEFVEMFVGVGAARVRDLFEQARKTAPAIVFIDEIDAIGQSRVGAFTVGGNEEREQTLNQLLAEIDGFSTDASNPVIIMAATNRPEVLDPALLRAGRFDRQVVISNPDLTGREQILKIHSKGIKLAKSFDVNRAARITPGFSGADLANVMNEAALLAARRKAESVHMQDFEAAIERVVAGLEKRTRVMNDRERAVVAYHESGHALIAELVPNADPVAKISIVPRGRGALGYTMQMPTEDRYVLGVEELEDRIAVMLGGRAAERVVFDTISTGASDDIMRATDLARRMITEFGMSEKLGSVRYAGQQLQYLGQVQDAAQISPHTREVIDQEVQSLVTAQYERAVALLGDHRNALEGLSRRLLEQETVDGSAVKEALEAERPAGVSGDTAGPAGATDSANAADAKADSAPAESAAPVAN